MAIANNDFSNLYTHFLHNKLENVIRQLINFCFEAGGRTWSDTEDKFKVTFYKASLKLVVNFLLDNCFFNFGNLSFQQITGIPIGSDPATFMANRLLYYSENKYLLNTKKIFT